MPLTWHRKQRTERGIANSNAQPAPGQELLRLAASDSDFSVTISLDQAAAKQGESGKTMVRTEEDAGTNWVAAGRKQALSAENGGVLATNRVVLAMSYELWKPCVAS